MAVKAATADFAARRPSVTSVEVLAVAESWER